MLKRVTLLIDDEVDRMVREHQARVMLERSMGQNNPLTFG